MSGIHVFNITKEEHFGPNVFYCGRGSILGNPYTQETKAKYVVKDRETAIERYADYFNLMYGSHREFTRAVNEIYERYKAGQDVYLGCYCKPQSCHCDVIVDKLRKKLVKEKLESFIREKPDNR